MSVALASSTTAFVALGGAGPTSLSVNPPSGLQAGDLWVITVGADVDSLGKIGLPSGFTAVSASWWSSDYPEGRSMWKIAGSSESAVNVPIQYGFDVWACSQRWTGAHQTSPIGDVQDTNGDFYPGGTSPQTATPDPVSVASNGSAVVVHTINAITDTSGYHEPPSGYTEIADREAPGGSYVNFSVSYKQVNAGTETPGEVTIYAGSSISRIAMQTFVILPATVSATPPHARPYSPDAAGMRTVLRM